MTRWLLAGFGLIAVLLLVGWRQFSPPAQAGADGPPVPALSGKPILILAKDKVGFSLEKPEVRQLGGRSFVVGREMKNAPSTKEQFGGATVWLPVDAITQIVELEPPKGEK
jgi:hypothetical protein